VNYGINHVLAEQLRRLAPTDSEKRALEALTSRKGTALHVWLCASAFAAAGDYASAAELLRSLNDRDLLGRAGIPLNR
jgi:hypothetical protein